MSIRPWLIYFLLALISGVLPAQVPPRPEAQGLAAFRAGRYGAASRIFAQLLAAQPNSLHWALLLSRCRLRQHRPEAVLPILGPFEAGHRHDLDLDWVLGSALVLTGHYRSGAPLVEAVAHARGSGAAYLMAAQARLRLGELRTAAGELAEARRRAPHLAGVRTLQGEIWANSGHIGRAQRLLSQVVREQPSNFEARLQLGNALYLQRNFPAAAQNLSEALRLQPNEPRALYSWGRTEIQLGHLHAARRALERTEAMRPGVLAVHLELLALDYRLGDRPAGAKERRIVQALRRQERQRLQADFPASSSRPTADEIELSRLARLGQCDRAQTLLNRMSRQGNKPLRWALILATCRMRRNEPQAAIPLLQPYVAAHPRNPDLNWVLGTALIATGDYGRGAPMVERVARRKHLAGGYLMAAQAWYRDKELQRADADLKEAQRLRPHLSGERLLQSQIWASLGQNAAARRLLAQVVREQPANFEAHLQLGNVLYRLGEFAAARQQLRAALRLRPGQPDSLYALGRAEVQLGDWTAARAALTAAEKARPNWLEPHLELATLDYRIGAAAAGARERQAAQTIRRRQNTRLSADVAPATPAPAPPTAAELALFQRARAAQQQGEMARAAVLYRRLLQSDPHLFPARANLGVVLSAQRLYPEAIVEYQKALALDPGNAVLKLDLGLAYFKSGQMAPAREIFAPLYQADPSNTRLAVLLGTCDVQTGHPRQAEAVLAPQAHAHPGDLSINWPLAEALIQTGKGGLGAPMAEAVAEKTHNAEVYLVAGQAFLNLSLAPRAKRDYDKAAALNPQLPGLRLLRGKIEASQGDLPGAEASYRAALAANPNNFEARLQLSDVLFQLGHSHAADGAAHAALLLHPHSWRALYELGRAETREGELQAAAEHLTAAEKMRPQWLSPHIELAALDYRLHHPKAGMRERQIVDQLMAAGVQRRPMAETGPGAAAPPHP